MKVSNLLERLIGEELYINEVVFAYLFIRTFSEKTYPDLKKNREF